MGRAERGEEASERGSDEEMLGKEVWRGCGKGWGGLGRTGSEEEASAREPDEL